MRNRRMLAALLSAALMTSAVPQVTMAAEKEKKEAVIIVDETFNTYENAVDLAGDKAREHDVVCDPTQGWQGLIQDDVHVEYAEEIGAGATLTFDVIIPDNVEFDGKFQAMGVTKMGPDWHWVQSEQVVDLDKYAFAPLGNGYQSATVKIVFDVEIEAVTGLRSVVPYLAASHCDYQGKVYIDNVMFKTAVNEDDGIEKMGLTFDENITGWSDSYDWEYSGGKTLVHDPEIGEGALKVSLDYSKNSSAGWSEAKVEYNPTSAIDVKGYNKIYCDFIYDPSKRTQGSFMLKFDIGGITQTVSVDGGKDIGNGLKKVTVGFDASNMSEKVYNIFIGIVGANTDYVGDVYLDNLLFAKTKPLYNPATLTIEREDSISVDSGDIELDGIIYDTVPVVELVDKNAIPRVGQLYAYLDAVGNSEGVMFGHQNSTHYKAGSQELSKSDIVDVTGSMPAVLGLDSLSLTGNEYGQWDMPVEEKVDNLVALTKEAHDANSIITLSLHLPNFEVIHNRVLNHVEGTTDPELAGYAKDGSYNFYGYTPGVLTGNIVPRIMPGQDLNYLFTAYLDIIAEYALKLQELDIPVLFRPFHEGTGSWFWWGADLCTEQEFIDVFRYTVEYMRDVKGVHNFLYVYGPGHEPKTVEDYEARYPGDDYVDMVGFDMYHQRPRERDGFLEDLKEELDLLEAFSEKHNKLIAVTETGISNGNEALSVTDNVRPEWYNEVLDVVSSSKASYFLVWANFGANSGYYTPYVTSVEGDTIIGHEMLDNFIDFYNDPRSIFAKQQGDYTKLYVKMK